MPRWLLVVTVALSLAALLLIANLPDSGSDSDNFKFKSNLEMPSSSRGTSLRHATTLAAVRATGRTVASAWSTFSPNPWTMMLAPSDSGLHPRRSSGRQALWRQRGQVDAIYQDICT